MTTVDAREWAGALSEAASKGYVYLDLLTAVDDGDRIDVIARVLDPSTMDAVMLTTSVASEDPLLPSIVASHPAAAWHERETAEMFGVTFAGHPDPRPLILRSVHERPPLRRSTPLVERLATPWPAAVDPAVERRPRRQQLPPGVRTEWVDQP